MKVLGALKNMKRLVDTWDDMIIHLIVNKLGSEFRKDWQLHFANKETTELPTFKDLEGYIKKRRLALENCEPSFQSKTSPSGAPRHSHATSSVSCPSCKEKHLCIALPFGKWVSISEEHQWQDSKFASTACGQVIGAALVHRQKCQRCHQQHHTMLHPENKSNSTQGTPSTISAENHVNVHSPVEKTQATTQGKVNESTPCISTAVHSHFTDRGATAATVLLATAVVTIRSLQGQQIQVRVMLDDCSDETFISERVSQLLNLSRLRVRVHYNGAGDQPIGVARSEVTFQVLTKYPTTETVTVNALVLPKVTGLLPSRRVEISPV